MKKGARLLSIMTACIMTFTLVGCGSKAKSTSDQASKNDLKDIIPKNTVTLNVYDELANFSGEQIGWFGKIMKDKFNVKLNIVKSADGVFATRAESGNLGDLVIFGDDSTNYKQAVSGKLLYDWNKDDLLKDYGPYIEKNMQKALDKNKSISGGTLYGFGHDVGSSSKDYAASMYGPYIRWDLYKQLGYPKVNTLDDYVKILGDMQKLAPTSDTGKKTYGASLFKDWDGNMVMFAKSTAALYGWDEFGFGLYNVNTGEYQDALQKDGMYIKCLKFYNQLYQKGLLDPDSMTQTSDDMNETYKNGGAFFNIFDFLSANIYNTDKHLSAGKAMMPLAAADQKNVAYGLNVNGNNRLWTIGAKTQYPELCMAIINWLSTPEGVMTYTYGPKGVTWDYDKDGRPILTDLGEKCQSSGDTELTGAYSGKFSDGNFKINNSTWALDSVNPDAKNGDTFNYKFWASRQSKNVSDVEGDWRKSTGATNINTYLKKNNQVAVSLGTTFAASAKSNELTTTWNQVKTAIVTYSWKAIYAKNDAEFDSIVKEMTDKANSYGYADCVKFQQNEAKTRKDLDDKARAGK